MTKYSILILSYDDENLVMRPFISALESDAEAIILVGGGKIPWEMIDAFKDHRLVKIHETERSGKARAISKSLAYAKGDIIFLVSGDISFKDSIFSEIIGKFDNLTGVVVPRVLPSNLENMWEKSCKVLWDLHDSQLRIMTGLSKSAHGGELIAVRFEILKNFREVINDDAFLCLKSLEMGFKVVYSSESVVTCRVPSNFTDIIDQRRRIIYGHIELMKIGLDPMVMDTLAFRNFRIFLLILTDFLKRHREDFPFFPLTLATELISFFLAKADHLLGRDHTIWKIVPRFS